MIFGHVDQSITAVVVGVLLTAVLAGIGRLVHLVVVLRDDMQKRVGQPNGKGNLTQMLETLLAGQTAQDSRLAVHDAQIAINVEALRAYGDRLGAIEQDIAAIRADHHS